VRSSTRKLKVPFLPQISGKAVNMKAILGKLALVALAAAVPVTASAQAPIEGRWKNPKGNVIVNVARCGNAYCGTVSWASAKNREHGAGPGTRVLSDLRPAGAGLYKGSAFEPKRNVRGSATVRQIGPNVMVVRGCALLDFICKEQRWTRVS
jgi:uncharacterized protein (DUF2147 family)